MSDSKNIVLFGGTSPTGIATAKEALKRGHKLTLYIRNPAKVPEEIKNHADVRIVEGQLDNVEAVKMAIAGNEVVISLLGPVIGTRTAGHVFADFYTLLLPLLREANIHRIFVCSTCSAKAPEDKFQLLVTLAVQAVKMIAGYAYQEINSVKALFMDGKADTSGIEWTMFRIMYLKDTDEQEVAAGFPGDGKVGLPIERPGIARWLMDRVADGGTEWVGKAPALYSYGKKGQQ